MDEITSGLPLCQTLGVYESDLLQTARRECAQSGWKHPKTSAQASVIMRPQNIGLSEISDAHLQVLERYPRMM